MGFDPISYSATQSNSAAISQLPHPTIVTVAENKVLALTDDGTIQNVTAAATITVPPNANVAFRVSTQISIISFTASDVAIVAGDGVNVRSKDGKLKIDGQYAAATLFKVATNEWLLIGALKT